MKEYKLWVHIEEWENGEPVGDVDEMPYCAGMFETLDAAHARAAELSEEIR